MLLKLLPIEPFAKSHVALLFAIGSCRNSFPRPADEASKSLCITHRQVNLCEIAKWQPRIICPSLFPAELKSLRNAYRSRAVNDLTGQKAKCHLYCKRLAWALKSKSKNKPHAGDEPCQNQSMPLQGLFAFQSSKAPKQTRKGVFASSILKSYLNGRSQS